jgi:hypothetical protein
VWPSKEDERVWREGGERRVLERQPDMAHDFMLSLDSVLPPTSSDVKITEEKKIDLIAKAERKFAEATAKVENRELVEAKLARIVGLFDELKKVHTGEKSEAASKCGLVD